MNNNKIENELLDLIAKIQAEMDEYNYNLSKPILEIFKEYDDTLDFDKYNCEIKITKNNSYSTYEINANTKNIPQAGWNSDKLISRIYFDYFNNKIYCVESNGRDNIDLDKGKEYLDYFIYARMTGIKLTKICFDHNDTISQKLVNVNLNNKADYFTAKQDAITYMINFAREVNKYKIIDKIWTENGISIKEYTTPHKITVSSFDKQSKSISIDSLEFSKNNTGTYNVYLKCDNNIVSSSTRCNNNTLSLIIENIAYVMKQWDLESLKNI
jgi:hypothetical protein